MRAVCKTVEEGDASVSTIEFSSELVQKCAKKADARIQIICGLPEHASDEEFETTFAIVENY